MSMWLSLTLLSLAPAIAGDRDGDGLDDSRDPCPDHARGTEAQALPPDAALPEHRCPDGTEWRRVGVEDAQVAASDDTPAAAAPAPAAVSAPPPVATPVTTPIAAGLFSGQGTPWTVGAGNGAVGIARPLTLGVGDSTDVTVNTTLGVALLAPTASVKRTVAQGGSHAFAVAVEAGVPTFAWRQFQTGFLQPIRSDQVVPLAAVVGVTGLGGWRNESLVVSAGLRARVGVPLGDGDVTAQDLVWLDPALAPISEGWSLQPTVRVDWLPTPRWQLTAQGRAEVAGGPELQGKLDALWAASRRVALGVGVNGAIAKEGFGWSVPAMVPLAVTPTVDVQARW